MKSILALITLLLIASCGSQTPSYTSTADTPATVEASDQPLTVVDDAPVETPPVDLTAPDLDNNGIPYLDKPVTSGTLRASSTSSQPEDCPADTGPDCDPFTMMGIILEIRAAFVESAVGYGLYLRGELIENFIVSELPPNQTEIFYDVSTRIMETGDAAVDGAALQAYLDESIYQLEAYDANGNGSGLTDPVIWVRGND